MFHITYAYFYVLLKITIILLLSSLYQLNRNPARHIVYKYFSESYRPVSSFCCCCSCCVSALLYNRATLVKQFQVVQQRISNVPAKKKAYMLEMMDLLNILVWSMYRVHTETSQCTMQTCTIMCWLFEKLSIVFPIMDLREKGKFAKTFLCWCSLNFNWHYMSFFMSITNIKLIYYK